MRSFPATSDAIACTLGPAELRDTQAAWQKLMSASLIAREQVPGGLRLRFHPASSKALQQLVDIERECCAWISFEITGGTLTMTSAGAGEATIREMWS